MTILLTLMLILAMALTYGLIFVSGINVLLFYAVLFYDKSNGKYFFIKFLFFISLIFLFGINGYMYVGYQDALYHGCEELCMDGECEYPPCFGNIFFKIYRDMFWEQLFFTYSLFLYLLYKYKKNFSKK